MTHEEIKTWLIYVACNCIVATLVLNSANYFYLISKGKFPMSLGSVIRIGMIIGMVYSIFEYFTTDIMAP